MNILIISEALSLMKLSKQRDAAIFKEGSSFVKSNSKIGYNKTIRFSPLYKEFSLLFFNNNVTISIIF